MKEKKNFNNSRRLNNDQKGNTYTLYLLYILVLIHNRAPYDRKGTFNVFCSCRWHFSCLFFASQPLFWFSVFPLFSLLFVACQCVSRVCISIQNVLLALLISLTRKLCSISQPECKTITTTNQIKTNTNTGCKTCKKIRVKL